MSWVDRMLAVRPRTWALVVVLLGLVMGCISVGSLLASGAFAGEPLSAMVPFLGLCFAVTLAPCLFFGLVCLLWDALVRRRGEFLYPFRSAVVRDICEHMTAGEKARFRRLGAAYGVPLGLLAGVLAVALSYGFGEASLATRIVVMGAAVLGFVVLSAGCRRKSRRFLSSTLYASERGLEPSDIPLWQWPAKSR